MLAVAFAAGVACAQNGDERPNAQEAERIPVLVKQLGAEAFYDREAATTELEVCAWKAERELAEAARSNDSELRLRASALLRTAQSQRDERRWLRAMRETWPKALKSGRMPNPLLGQWETSAQSEEPATKEALAEGASTVESCLEWLTAHQSLDGSWDGSAEGGQCSAKIENTAVAVLAILDAGHSPKVGKYKVQVQNGIAYLMRCQRGDGAILNPGWKSVDVAAHTWAGIALSEGAGMSRIPEITQAAQKALDYSSEKLRGAHGGFGREPESKTPDLVSTTLAILHVRISKISGLRVPVPMIDGLLDSLDTFDDPKAKTFRMVEGGATSAEATMLGVFARTMLGFKTEELTPYWANAQKNYPGQTGKQNELDPLLNWLGTQIACMNRVECWKEWNGTNQMRLKELSIREGPDAGTWRLTGDRQGGGKVLSNAFHALSLEIRIRYTYLAP